MVTISQSVGCLISLLYAFKKRLFSQDYKMLTMNTKVVLRTTSGEGKGSTTGKTILFTVSSCTLFLLLLACVLNFKTQKDPI